MDMEEVEMECILFRKMSKKVGGDNSYVAKEDHSLGKLEKYVLMLKCSEYQTDYDSKVKMGGCSKHDLY